MTPERIRRIRKSLGYTQERLAQILGVAWTTVHRWESGSSTPTGIPARLLLLLEQRVGQPDFQAALRDARASDPMFILYSLLGNTYSAAPSARTLPGRGLH